jgi:hypothetical protein
VVLAAGALAGLMASVLAPSGFQEDIRDLFPSHAYETDNSYDARLPPLRGGRIGFGGTRPNPLGLADFRARAAATGWREVLPVAPADLSFTRAGHRAEVIYWDDEGTSYGTLDLTPSPRREPAHMLAGALVNLSLVGLLIARGHGWTLPTRIGRSRG